MADVWKLLDKEVPDQKIVVDVDDDSCEEEPVCDEECLEMERELRLKMIKEEQDDDECLEILDSQVECVDHLSMEQRQEWVTATRALALRQTKVSGYPFRPRYITKNPRLFWSCQRMDDLMACRDQSIQRFKCQNSSLKRSQMELIYRSFKRLHPKTRLSRYQVLGKCIKKTP